MSESSADSIERDFLNELKDYIPALRAKAAALKEYGGDPADSDLAELHRLVHTIRGASSLVRLSNLCKVATAFEELVEEVICDRLTIDMEVFEIFVHAIDYFDTYSKRVPCNDAFDPAQAACILEGLHGCRKFAAEDNGRDLLSQLLRSADIETADTPATGADDGPFDTVDLDAELLVADDDALEMLDPGSQSDIVVDLDNRDGDDGWADIDVSQQELLEGFYQEAEDHFQDLGKVLSELETQIRFPAELTAEHKERLRLIRRFVHTIKGAAAVIKLKPVAAWGHEFEDVLDWLYDEAAVISPEVIRVIAEAADILELLVSSPQQADDRKCDALRAAFRRIIGSGPHLEDRADSAFSGGSSEMLCSVDGAHLPDDGQGPQAVEDVNVKTEPQAKTLRVDMTKVESLVNLAGELTVALSAFDQDMEGLGKLIGEVDRARLRLKTTAHDLEMGYEVKAIQQLGAPRTDPQLAGGRAAEKTAAFSDFDALELDRYSELNLIIRSLSETAVDVSTISRQLTDIYSGFDGFLNRFRILLSELHQKTMRMRMAPMSTIVNRMRHTIRETALQLDKKVQLTTYGEHIELDKLVWEKLADPLMHLLRNAVDHGIEPVAIRQAAGKPEMAEVHISAAYQGNQVVIRVSDDGGGLDYEAIRKAVASFQPDEDVAGMSEASLADWVFQSGFSSRQTISEVSGRGVGLDVVKENIRDLKGNVRIEKSGSGLGTTFCITLPLTTAVMQALLFEAGGRRYATALYDIEQILRVDPKEISGQEHKTITIGGRSLPFYCLSEHMRDGLSEIQTGGTASLPLVLIVAAQSWKGAVAIDRMSGQREVVIKNLGAHLRHVQGVAGATVMGDGKVVPILNLAELLEGEAAKQPTSGYANRHQIQKPLEIMVVDDSVSVRTVVARLMQRQGWHVQTAKDGVEAIERLHTRQPDLIVLDVEMPRMNGYEFMSSMRSQATFKNIPVIMLTSRAAQKHREKAKALGVKGFMTKPYVDEEFVALVKQLGGLNGM
ncbi:MAG: hypothetical protein VR64_02625 [Desulfatitalea sp. BRH_c12]|nr:MAG: hypothetical protein VR64_02625 [Desulfatitalea sp. BRH_c12]